MFFRQALNHSYFFALPNPTHHSKLPKPTSKQAPRTLPLEELDGNAAAKNAAVNTDVANARKRKRESGGGPGEPAPAPDKRSVSRKLDFASSAGSTS